MDRIYEDDEILILNKPAGMLVHTDGISSRATVVDWIQKNYPDINNIGESLRLKSGEVVERPGIVHRLDRDTSGVLVIAKSQEMFEHLKAQFAEHAVGKEYRAFVYGWVKEDEGKIVASIARSKSDFRKWSAQRGKRGKEREAVTEYKVLKRFEDSEGNKISYLALYPKTGRTHQIRVHMKYFYHPVICDSLYAEGKPCLLGFSRQALHAYSITFNNLKGEKVTFQVPLPSDFERALDRLKEV